MARQRQIIETVTCDLCGEGADDASTVTLGWGREQWELDLCLADKQKVSKTFDKWTEKGRKVRGARNTGRRNAVTSSSKPNDDWYYLESLGFMRHRGRKTAEEQQALKNRK